MYKKNKRIRTAILFSDLGKWVLPFTEIKKMGEMVFRGKNLRVHF